MHADGHRHVTPTAAKTFLCLALLALAFPPRAHAYLDPGTGSMIFQLLAGAVLAGAVTAKLWWGYVRSLCQRLLGLKKDQS